MLPDTDDLPPSLPKFTGHLTIALCVPPDLLYPERPIADWQAAVQRTAVPKAAINEYRKTALCKNEVRLSADRSAATPSFNSKLPKNTNKADLCRKVAMASDTSHYLGALLR